MYMHACHWCIFFACDCKWRLYFILYVFFILCRLCSALHFFTSLTVFWFLCVFFIWSHDANPKMHGHVKVLCTFQMVLLVHSQDFLPFICEIYLCNSTCCGSVTIFVYPPGCIFEVLLYQSAQKSWGSHSSSYLFLKEWSMSKSGHKVEEDCKGAQWGRGPMAHCHLSPASFFHWVKFNQIALPYCLGTEQLTPSSSPSLPFSPSQLF